MQQTLFDKIFIYGYYYIILALFGFWLIQLIHFAKYKHFSFIGFFKENAIGIITTFLLAGLCFASVPLRLKTLSDETNLLAVSQSMLINKTTYLITMGRNYFENFHPTNFELSRRPVLFPFFTYLVHLVVGYSYKNAFVVNFFTLSALLLLAYLLGKRLGNKATGVAAQILLLCNPLVTTCATCGGFDLFALFFVVLSFAILWSYLTDHAPETFAFLWMTLLMLAHIRYESFVYFFIILGGMIITRSFSWNLLKKQTYLYILTPVFFLPIILQRLYYNWDWGQEPQTDIFSGSHFMSNVYEFFKGLFGLGNPELLSASLLNIVGAAALVYLVIAFLKKKIQLAPSMPKFLFIGLLALCVNCLIVFLYYFGIFSHPSGARFFLLPTVFLSIIPLFLHHYRPLVLNNKLLFSGSVLCFILYHPVAIESRFINSLTLNREFDYTLSYLQKSDEKKILVIADRPGMYTSLEYGAVDFNYANKNAADLLRELDRHLFMDITVFQKIRHDNLVPIDSNKLDPAFKLYTIQEVQVTATEFLRISKVTLAQQAAVADPNK